MGKKATLTGHGAVAQLKIAADLLDAEVVQAIRAACDSIDADASIRAVVVTGGKDFSRDWDWPAIGGESADELRAQGWLDDPFGCLAALPKPVVCAISGECLGGGLALALACDIRIAADNARFGLPETSMGLLPLGGATQRLSRLVGRGAALEMVLAGETIGAEDALRIGLVSEVVPAAKLEARAMEIASRVAERGPLAVAYAKEAVQRGIDMTLEQALRYETDLTIILQTTEDRAEGVRAFLEKRQPKFKGK